MNAVRTFRKFVFPGVVAAALLVSCGGDSSGYDIGGTVAGLATGTQLVLRNGDDQLVVTSDGTFEFPTSLARGEPFSVIVTAQPSGSTCVATNASGTAGAESSDQAMIVCSRNNYVVSVQVSGLVEADKARPGFTGSGFLLQNNLADDLAIVSDGSLAFTAPVPSGSSYAVTIAQQPVGRTCAVSQAGGSITDSNVAVSVTCSPTADASPFRLYIANAYTTQTITTYAVDATTGAPGAVLGVTAGSQTNVFATNGRYAYTQATEALFTSKTNEANGALELFSSIPSSNSNMSSGAGFALDPKGQFLYSVLFSHGGSAVFYKLEDGGGTPVLTTPPSQGAVFGAGEYAPHPEGRIVYAANGFYGFDAFSLNSMTGGWNLIQATPVLDSSEYVELLEDQANLSFHPNGKFAYYTTHAGTVAAYSIDPTTGALTRVAGSPFAASSAYGFVVFDRTGTFAYVASSDPRGVISGYRVDAVSGVLTPLSGSPFVFGSQRTARLVFHPNGRNLYVTTSSTGSWAVDGVLQCIIDPSTGVLTALPGVPVPLMIGITTSSIDHANEVRMAPNGTFAYLLSGDDATTPGNLSVMTIDPSTGALSARVVPLGTLGGGSWIEAR